MCQSAAKINKIYVQNNLYKPSQFNIEVNIHGERERERGMRERDVKIIQRDMRKPH